MTKPRTIKAWGVFTKRGRLVLVELHYDVAKWLAEPDPDAAPHTVRRVTITVEDK